MSHTEDVAKVTELLKDNRMAMITTVDEDGRLVSRPMATQEVEFDGDLWFFADGDSATVHQVQRSPRVNVSLSSASTWVSIAGDAEVVHDAAKRRELWNSMVEAWFPEGPDTPGLVLLKIHADTAEYWDTPGGKVASLLSFAKTRLTGATYDADHGTADL